MSSKGKLEKIVIVGFGWVGQANALALVRMGFEVFYYDVLTPKYHYSDKYQRLYEKIKPLETLLQVDDPDTWYIVCIGDRVDENGFQDISSIEKTLESLRSAQGKIILRSTVLPKYLKDLPFHIYLPEFLHEINAVEDCLNPFIFALGSREKIIYPSFIKQWEKRAYKVFKGTPEETSYIKYLSNIWNSLRIAFVNEFGDGISLPKNKEQQEKIANIIDFFFDKKSYLRYGRAYSGHCLPKDTHAFTAWKKETAPSPILKAIHESNQLHQQTTDTYALPQWFSSWDYDNYRRGVAALAQRWWQKLNSLVIIKRARHFLKPIIRFFESLAPNKSLGELKAKWEKLVKKNAYYYANPDTKNRQNVDEFELRQTGEEDYLKYVANDDLLQKSLSNFNNKVVLEIGAGVGRMTEFFSKNFNTVYGVDIAPSMLSIAHKRLPSLNNIDLIENMGNDLPFPDEKFDLIFSYLVFKHLPNTELIQNYFKEIARSLKPNGIAKIQLRTGATPHFWQWFYGASLTPEQAQILARKVGLKIEKTEIENSKSLWLWLKK
ncbi:methyltransferase domain-containing protein [Patescibacteria group bacterium]|nr:methyltransferase domain-containing protein [Patescibacteria group bacterium]